MAVATDPSDAALTDFLRVVGHPLRWRLLSALGRSDRRVHELTELTGEAQNLVSYHLGKLRDVDLVTARRSSADGRDTYYRMDPARFRAELAATGVAVHPGLRLTAAPLVRDPSGPAVARVLFLCTGNSARSQMAEAMVASWSGGAIEARSAGSHPKALHPNAVRTMRDAYGIDISRCRPKHLGVFAEERFDRVITLCDRVREICPELPGAAETAHWSMPDPTAGGHDDTTLPAFVDAAAELASRIGFLLAELMPSEALEPDPPEET